MKKSKKFLYLSLIIIPGLILLALYLTRSNKVEYSKYIPPKEFKITFECPDNWTWSVSDMLWDGFGGIYTNNPDSQYPYDGLISFDVRLYETPEKTETEMNEAVAFTLQSIKGSQSDVLSDRTFEIDGYFARQIISKWGPFMGEGRFEPIIKESIYILVENSYYRVNLNIFESERYGEFGQGFDHMIESIKFIP